MKVLLRKRALTQLHAQLYIANGAPARFGVHRNLLQFILLSAIGSRRQTNFYPCRRRLFCANGEFSRAAF